MVIEFLNGEREYFYDDGEETLWRIIGERLGDGTEYLLSCVLDDKEDRICALENCISEHERIADGYYGILNNVLEELSSILEYMDGAKRINSEKVYKMIANCKREIIENI